jgi:hypothetical protein
VRPLSTVEEGARAILNLATSLAVEGQTGLYFNGLREAKAQVQAYDPDARRRLQALSLELTRPIALSRPGFMRGARQNEHGGYAPPLRPAALNTTQLDRLRDQKFESPLLQR